MQEKICTKWKSIRSSCNSCQLACSLERMIAFLNANRCIRESTLWSLCECIYIYSVFSTREALKPLSHRNWWVEYTPKEGLWSYKSLSFVNSERNSGYLNDEKVCFGCAGRHFILHRVKKGIPFERTVAFKMPGYYSHLYFSFHAGCWSAKVNAKAHIVWHDSFKVATGTSAKSVRTLGLKKSGRAFGTICALCELSVNNKICAVMHSLTKPFTWNPRANTSSILCEKTAISWKSNRSEMQANFEQHEPSVPSFEDDIYLAFWFMRSVVLWYSSYLPIFLNLDSLFPELARFESTAQATDM